MKKRLLSTLLALCVALALLPMTALAADSDFVIEDGVLTGYNGPGGDVVIPDGVTSIVSSAFVMSRDLTSVTIPGSVKSINNYAFGSCDNLTSVIISEGVESIGEHAFSETRLTSVTIPNTVTYIGRSAFFSSYLKSVTISTSITSIEAGTFLGTGLTTVTIPAGVTSIGGNAFGFCYSLASVTIPASVTTIEAGAFEQCGSLTDVYYGGSEDQWAQIDIDNEEDWNAPLLNANIHYNSPMPDAPTTPAQPEQPTTPSAPADTKAVLSPQGLKVDGKDIDCEKYNIADRNYFKLRDLAQLLSGTGSQFQVGYDEASKTVSITTGQAYTPNGTELLTDVDNSASAQPSSQAILIDGVRHDELTVYNIGGSNFFQIRELGALLGFEVDYDQDTNTAIVNSVEKETPRRPHERNVPPAHWAGGTFSHFKTGLHPFIR